MFTPLQLGACKLAHRVVMAPLTRVRGTDTFAPNPHAAEYYTQRATAGGLLITEAVPISPETPNDYSPGIYTEEQEREWKRVVDSVHEKGGLMSIQLWHVGRVAHESWGQHPLLQKLGRPLPTVSSSATPLPDAMRFSTDFVTKQPGAPPSMPRALTKEEITGRLIDDYVAAAKAAVRAGFDIIEVHAAHGYLIDQFLNNGVNKRTDEFGGSVENRMRLLHLVMQAVIKAVGGDAGRVAVRISPTYPGSMTFFDCHDSDPVTLYREVVKSLAQYNLAYLLLTEPRWNGSPDNDDPRKDKGMALPIHNAWAREVYPHKIIGAGGFTPASAKLAIENGVYDAIAFGRFFISTPDLPRRLKEGLPLNAYDRSTFYTRDGVAGYTDYPNWEQRDDPKFKKVELIKQEEIGQFSK